jgi:NADH dehydrogenase
MPVTVTVFGGTGFLGRAMVSRLLEQGATVRIAARHPQRVQTATTSNRLQLLQADVRDKTSVASAVGGARAVVNAVALYSENRRETFDSVHVQGAGIVAEEAARAGAEMLVHLSGIGADPASPSKYVRARAEGERAVMHGFTGTVVVRPSVMFGPGDTFLNAIDTITRIIPVFPLFGKGSTRLQPVFVGDVADGIARLLDHQPGARLFEFGGPEVLSYRAVVEALLRYRCRRRLLLPVPYAVWSAQARLMRLLPHPPITEDQVILMRGDNVVGKGVATLADLGVHPGRLGDMLPVCLLPKPG